MCWVGVLFGRHLGSEETACLLYLPTYLRPTLPGHRLGASSVLYCLAGTGWTDGRAMTTNEGKDERYTPSLSAFTFAHSRLLFFFLTCSFLVSYFSSSVSFTVLCGERHHTSRQQHHSTGAAAHLAGLFALEHYSRSRALHRIAFLGVFGFGWLAWGRVLGGWVSFSVWVELLLHLRQDSMAFFSFSYFFFACVWYGMLCFSCCLICDSFLLV